MFRGRLWLALDCVISLFQKKKTKKQNELVTSVDRLPLQIVVDEVGYELLDEHLSAETADYSSDASVSSAPLRRRNKRKAYVPRGACSVLVPAGVDLFEPEYDPLPGPSSGILLKTSLSHFKLERL